MNKKNVVCNDCENFDLTAFGNCKAGSWSNGNNHRVYECDNFQPKPKPQKTPPKIRQFDSMEDSGKRQQFDTGAVRDTAEGKSRPDLISPYAQMRKGEWLRLGAKKYSERNWEKGMKISRCVASLERHVQEYKMGLINEDHLAAIAVNVEFIMHYEKMIEMGMLPSELDDMPKYEQQKKLEEKND